ncbi:MAG: hypothetical protein WBL10_06355 [Candidatus Methanoculleus thermohydrogenotrophicum]|nr:hypothetical protein [Candidatus Methanoculleus thermohydrogenotrophicum]HPZ37909.1 hypothetical protein [Candidatus Methanoculleus thermohydrogenotrophicum]HQC90724.1 hypothetical protein [Candidatus Methanoculleus thermohydrogenotrophicum]
MITMTGENEKKDGAKIGSQIKDLFSSGCGCGTGGGCCGTRIVPKKKEEPDTGEQ